MTWNERWHQEALLVASWSKDRSTKVGAVIVNEDNRVISTGWNGFPRGVDDNVEARHDRPAKYKWTEHAERNAIYNAAACGHALKGCSIHLTWYPCADCARGIIQSGISKVVVPTPDWNDPRWGEDFRMVREMFTEIGMTVEFIDETV
jgi:dCMP deaminase